MPRPQLELAQDRQALIEAAMAKYYEECDHLVKQQHVANWMDVMSLSYFHNVLFGDVDGARNALVGVQPEPSRWTAKVDKVSLHEEIARQRYGRSTEVDMDPMSSATSEQVEETVRLLVDRRYRNIWELKAKRAEFESEGHSYQDALPGGLDGMYSYMSKATAVIQHPNTQSLNVHDSEKNKSVVWDLVKLDRLPRRDILEGLLLLREAWDEYDVKMHLASRYKLMTKVSYACLLAFSVITVTLTMIEVQVREAQLLCDSLREDACPKDKQDLAAANPATFSSLVFLVSLATAMLISTIGFMNPAQRWRRLRSCACTLESLIWQYRARIGAFSESVQNPRAPQQAFCASLQRWSQEVITGADLQSSSMEKKYAESVYQHFQWKGHPRLIGEDDDFHSPVNPQDYMRLRLQPMLDLYQARIPVCMRVHVALHVIVFLCSSSSAALVYFKQPSTIAIVSSFASAVLSWSEFSQLGMKIERYTTAIRSMKDLRRWWLSMGEVEQNNREHVTRLMMVGETILSSEQLAWSATAMAMGKEDDVPSSRADAPEQQKLQEAQQQRTDRNLSMYA